MDFAEMRLAKEQKEYCCASGKFDLLRALRKRKMRQGEPAWISPRTLTRIAIPASEETLAPRPARDKR
jgi:hypothetical protein